jgi:hypothetical protein
MSMSDSPAPPDARPEPGSSARGSQGLWRRLVPAALISAAILGGLLWLVDPERWGELIARAEPSALALALALFAITTVLRGLRFAWLLTTLSGKKVGGLGGFDLAALNNLFNHLLPFRLGELSFLFFANSLHGVPLHRSGLSLLLARLHDMVALLMIVLTAAVFYEPALAVEWRVLLACAVLALFVFGLRLDLAVLTGVKVLAFVVARAPSLGPLTRIARKIVDKLSQLDDVRPTMKGLPFALTNQGYSLGIWASLIGFFHFFLASLGLGLPYAKVVLGSTGAALLPMLPINALGTVGPLEAGWTVGFVAMGLGKADATASGFLMHTVVIIVYLLAAGWAALRIGPAGLEAFSAWRRARAQSAAGDSAERAPLVEGGGPLVEGDASGG